MMHNDKKLLEKCCDTTKQRTKSPTRTTRWTYSWWASEMFAAIGGDCDMCIIAQSEKVNEFSSIVVQESRTGVQCTAQLQRGGACVIRVDHGEC